jgi:multisubunit Na+/H+ antiporter MnhB subunit
VNAIIKWMGIIFAIGLALMYIEYRYATKKKEGFTATDRMRITGIFWITIFFCGLVGWVMWVSD